MTRGEIIFCLRNVHRYWSTPRISHREMLQLVELKLVERTITGTCALRLTEEGVRVKSWRAPAI